MVMMMIIPKMIFDFVVNRSLSKSSISIILKIVDCILLEKKISSITLTLPLSLSLTHFVTDMTRAKFFVRSVLLLMSFVNNQIYNQILNSKFDNHFIFTIRFACLIRKISSKSKYSFDYNFISIELKNL